MPVLPRYVDAVRLCQQHASVSGRLPLSAMSRLSAHLVSAEGEADAVLAFGLDEQMRRTLTGQVSATVAVVCQRCLDTMHVPLVCELSLALVWTDEQAAQLPKSLDPVVLEDQELDVYSILEDELLLALPLAPVHDTGQCEPPVMPEPLDSVVPVKENPFQVLAALKSGAVDSD